MEISRSLRLAGSVALLCLSSLSFIPSASAGSATWNLNPANGDWNTAANWTPMTVPDGPSDTAFFSQSDTLGVSLSAPVVVDGITFNAGASAFTLAVGPRFRLTFSGVGV